MPEQLFEIGRRTFDTPEFTGIECIEVEAKSVINRVPGGSLPFDWTINPYRGCSHACTYCLAGETRVLMADGRTKAIAEVAVGDRVYGTVPVGRYRRYVSTEVLAHWSTMKPAHEVSLDDGTSLIASGDHRFLSDRGWKHVIGTTCGAGRRAHLSTGNQLLGPGRFPETFPDHGPDYRIGYVCGMIRGDGTLGSYSYGSAEHRRDVHRFRLALVDLEALRRTREFLSLRSVETDEFAFTAGDEVRKPLRAIRTSKQASVATIRDLIRWPNQPSDAWTRGFLAGIFDAEGSCNLGVLRISNTDPVILGRTQEAFTRLGFRTTRESAAGRCPTIRLLGGAPEHLRFFLTVDPAITRKRSIERKAMKNSPPRWVSSIQPLGVAMPMFDITTGTGDFVANGVVSHNCFARPTHTFLDMDAGRDFESKIVVKVNAPQVLRRQLAAPRWKGEHIAMGTGTDPYQRVEGRYRLMRGIIEALTEKRNPFSILTKGTLILRDVELLQVAAEHAPVSAAFSIGTLDERVWRETEPGTPHPKARIDAVRKLNEAGISTGVLMAPILPGISDAPEQLRRVVEAALEAGATHVSPILLHLRPGVREEFMPWLEQHHPDLVARYHALYPRPYASKRERDRLGADVTGMVRSARRRWPARPDDGVPPAQRFRSRKSAERRVAAEPVRQMPLW